MMKNLRICSIVLLLTLCGTVLCDIWGEHLEHLLNNADGSESGLEATLRQLTSYCDKKGKPSEAADIEKQANALKTGELDFTKAMKKAREMVTKCF